MCRVKEEIKWRCWRSEMKSYSWLKPWLPFSAIVYYYKYRFYIGCTSTYPLMRETKFLYHIHIFQELKPIDASKRPHFCHWLCNFIHNHYSVLDYILFSNGVWFHLISGYINAQNYRVQDYMLVSQSAVVILKNHYVVSFIHQYGMLRLSFMFFYWIALWHGALKVSELMSVQHMK